MANFSFHRASPPMPYSFGNPALNCWGGSFSTLGNTKRPVAARAVTEAAENAPHANPIQARRVSSGEVSSGSRVAAPAPAAAGLATAALAAAPPGEATFVVLPARSGRGAAGGLGAAGRAAGVVDACAAAAGRAPVAGALEGELDVGPAPAVPGGAGFSGGVSSAIFS